MAAEGLHSLFPMRELALMGLLEVLPNLRRLRVRLRETAADVATRRPDVVVTIDSPGFTLRLLKAIRPLGMPRAHYVAPQAWAWREAGSATSPGYGRRCSVCSPSSPPSSPATACPRPSSGTRCSRAARTGETPPAFARPTGCRRRRRC